MQKIPEGHHGLYNCMMERVKSQNDPDNVKLCQRILSTVILTCRPLHLIELFSVAELPDNLDSRGELVEGFVGNCGSFLLFQMILFPSLVNLQMTILIPRMVQIFPRRQRHRTVLFCKKIINADVLYFTTDICGLNTQVRLDRSQRTNSIIEQKLLLIKYETQLLGETSFPVQ